MTIPSKPVQTQNQPSTAKSTVPSPAQNDAEVVSSRPQTLDGRRLAGATMVVMVFFVLSRVSGLLREMIIGAQFGTSAELDAYLAAFRIPDLLFQLVAGGALGSAFIPTFSQLWAEEGEAPAWQLFSRILNLVTLILVMLAVLAVTFADPLVTRVIAPGFDPTQQQLAADLMRWMLVSTVIFGASGLVMGALNATQHFVLPAAAPVLYNGAIIVGAWLLAPTYGIYGLVIGVVVGALAHFGVQVPALMRKRARYRLDLTWRDPAVGEVGRLMAPRILGLFFVQLNFLVNTILASQLAAGSLAALNFAWLLMLLPQGIFAQAIATVAFPTFSAQVAAQDHSALRRTLDRTLRTVLFLTLPAAVGLFVLRVPVIQVLLQRGNFDAESTAAVAYALQFYALGLVAHALVEIVVRVFYALHDTLTPVLIGVGAMSLNILLSLVWIDQLGYGGLALANSVATTVEMIVLLWLLRRRVNGFSFASLIRGSIRSAAAAMLMGLAVWGWLTWLGSQVGWGSWLPIGWVAALSGMVVAVSIYMGSALLLGAEELRIALSLLGRRLTHR
ncbi:murein biosynthesis integral membrane protein MurJ [bacterium]|nr:murein biosynthesis integral membrane protein MurJ [bacterium]